MLFYPVGELEAAWTRARELFDAHELPGICGLKTSTADWKGPSHCIVFFTDTNEGLPEIGSNLVEQMRHVPMDGRSRVYHRTLGQATSLYIDVFPWNG